MKSALLNGVLAAGVLEAPLYPQGLPPRAAPADYLAHAQAGAVTIAAEFIGHFVPTPQGTLTTHDYVVVETVVVAEPEARLKMTYDNCSLAINGKKIPQA